MLCVTDQLQCNNKFSYVTLVYSFWKSMYPKCDIKKSILCLNVAMKW